MISDLGFRISDWHVLTRRVAVIVAVLLISAIAHPPSAIAQSDAEHQQFLFAYKLMQRNENKEAAEAFDEYLGKFPDGDKLGDAQYYRAMLYRKAGDNQKAATLLASAADPTIVPGYAVKLLLGQVHSDLKQYKRALAALEQIETDGLQPSAAFATHYLKASAYRASDNLAAAEASLQAAAKLQTPNKPRALLDLAQVQTQMKDNAEALATLDRCLALDDPATASVAARLAGDLSYNAGKHDQAIGYYNTVVTRYQATPHFAPALVGLMWAQFGGGQHAAVLKTYEQAKGTLPEDDRPTAAYLAGSAQQEQGNHEQAVPLLSDVARSTGPASIREKAMYKLAVSLYELKRYDEMNAAVASLIERFPRTDLRLDAAFLQASADAEAGRVEQGVARLTELIKQGPDQAYYGPALLRRAHLYETHGQLEAAVADYDAYLDTVDQPTPTALQAGLRLMELLTVLGRHERVVKLAQGVLSLDDPSLLKPALEQEALYRLAVAYRFQGELDQAMATHERLMSAHPINPFAAESVYEQGLIRMTRGQTEKGVPQLLDAAGREQLSLSRRISALRVVAQHAVDTNDTDRALGLRLKMQQLGGVEAFNDDERLWLGAELIERGEPARAIDYLSAVSDPEQQDRATLLIGRAHRAAGQTGRALAALNEVRAVSERYNLEAWLEIARVYRDQGKPEQALRELAALQNPDRGQRIASQALYEGGQIHKALAMTKLRSGVQAAEADIKAARDAFKKLWLLYPDRAGEDLAKRAYLHLAALQHAAGDAAGAVQTLSELIEAEPDTPHATLAKAVLADRAGKAERSAAYLRQLRQEAEGDTGLWDLVDELLESDG